MNLQTIDMDRRAAQSAVRAYRSAIRSSVGPDPRDVAALRGYRQLARGRRLMVLGDVFRAAGLAEFVWTPWNGAQSRAGDVPRLAVCDATAHVCFYDGRHFTAERDMAIRSGGQVGRDWVRCPIDAPRYRPTVRAVVPTVPPALRPPGGLGGFHILWEAEWSLARPIPPRDPALVKWLGGELWAVLAVWDLTDLERAILAGAAR